MTGRHPARGYALAAAAATLFSLNGPLARYLLDDGVDAMRLSQLRSAGALLVMLGVLALARPALLRVDRRELPGLAVLGVLGMAAVQATYFFAIDRIEIGPALTIQYLAPLLLLVWLRIVHGRSLAPALWIAVALSVSGCFLLVRGYDPGSLDALGVLAAFGAMLTFAFTIAGAERIGARVGALTTLFWLLVASTVLWTVVTPWWSFPWAAFDSTRNVLLGAGIAIVGTLVPFACMVAALRDVPAPRVAVVATLEPLLAAAVAWVVLGEALATVQIAGGAVVLSAVALVQLKGSDLEAEVVPPGRVKRR